MTIPLLYTPKFPLAIDWFFNKRCELREAVSAAPHRQRPILANWGIT